MSKKYEIIIDWLQFTIPDQNYLDVISKVLELDLELFSEIPRGKLGYKRQLTYRNISVLYDGTEDMGIHVIISGTGCRFFEQHDSLVTLIYKINRYKGKLTRIDLALDDREGDLLPFEKMLSDIISGNIVSRWKTNLEHTLRDMNGNTLGQTICVGSRSSDSYLRIYDKALEQGVSYSWIRLELELKKDNAERIQHIISMDNVGTIIQGVLRNYMRLLTPNSKDSNKGRWNNRRYWDKIIGTVPKIKLSRRPEAKTLEQKKEWLARQVGQTLAVVCLADGSIDFVYDLIRENAERLKVENQVLLEKHEQNQKELKKW